MLGDETFGPMNNFVDDLSDSIFDSLDACLKESEKVCADARRLRESNARLAIENELLRERLAKMGISPPRPCIVLAPPAAVPKSDA